jgi:hypothetical protein
MHHRDEAPLFGRMQCHILNRNPKGDELAMIITMRRIALISAALAIVGLRVVPAQAAERTIEQTPYQQSLPPTVCFDTNLSCEIDFPAVTAQTAIHNVACTWQLSTGAVVQQMALVFTNPNTTTFAAAELPVTISGPNANSVSAFANLQTLLFVATGVVPKIFFQLDSGSILDLNCTISGWTLEEKK